MKPVRGLDSCFIGTVFLLLLLWQAPFLLNAEPITKRDSPANETQVYWVVFSDRGSLEMLTPEEIRVQAARYGLTESAIERRRLEGLEGDSLVTLADLPPERRYVEEVLATGVIPRRTSRWFNRISVEASSGQIAEVEALPFVREIRPVAMGIPASWSYEEVGRWDGYPPPGPGIDLPGTYGPSYLQNLQVNAVEAHRNGYTGRGVLMMILDSGFELSHEAFSRLDVFAQYDFIEDDDYTGMEPEDDPGQPNHGSGCLSVLAGYSPGNLIGVAYEATFLLGKTEDVRREVIREEDNFIAAMEWGERLGARVLSASLSYKDWYTEADYDGDTPLTSHAANRARKLGLLCVTANGNEGPQPMTLGAPAEAWGVIAAGAVDSTGKIAVFSSRGPSADGRIKPDLSAMGVSTACISPQTEHYYSRWSGTSLSTPVLSGVCTLVRGAHPDWNVGQVIRSLKATASRADHPDNAYGWGIPDVMAAIRWPEIRIRVLGEDRRPVSGIKVRLSGVDPGADMERETVTDQGGVAAFANLPDGVWKYTVVPSQNAKLIAGELNGTFRCPDGGRAELIFAENEKADATQE